MVALLIGFPSGLLVGPLAAVLIGRWLERLPSKATLRERTQIQRDLPLVVDLLAAGLAAGAPPEIALEVVGTASGGPLGERLQRVATRLRMGGSPESAWASLSSDPDCAPLSRVLASSAARGGSPLLRLSGLADEARARSRWAAHARARAVGARAAAPLGLCFLPAFVLLGVVPLVIAAATTVF